MNKYTFIIILLGTTIFGACRKGQEKATVEYYITATQSESIEFVGFSLQSFRAYQANAFVSVYVEPANLFFITSIGSRLDTFYLGSSEIDPGIIEGYDYWTLHAYASINGLTFNLLDKEYFESNAASADISIREGEVKKVLFTINTDESITMLANRDFKFLPKIHVEAQ